MQDKPPSFKASIQLLGTRRFGTFWFASFLSNIGTWAQQVAQPWLLLSLGASSLLVGLDAFAMDAPVWVLTLGGGVLADRYDRRRVISLFQSVQMLCPTLLVVLLLTGAVQPWIVVCCSLVVGITDALSMPSFQSIVPSIVPHEKIGVGIALNSTQFNLSRIAGPALAGVLMASGGAIGCFTVSAASYLPLIAVALWILPRRKASEARDPFDFKHPFKGLRGIAQVPRLRRALLTVLVTSVFCAPLITFCPVLVKSTFAGDATRFSVTIAAFGVGGLIGGTGLLAAGARGSPRVTSLFAGCYGCLVVLAALSPWFWALPVLLVLAGVAMSVSNISANALLQSTASATLRGQTVSLYMLAMRGGVSIGSLVTGLTITLLGVRDALVVNGLVAVLLQLWIARGAEGAVSSPGSASAARPG